MTDANTIPDGWKSYTLGEVATPSDQKVDPNKLKDVQYVGLEHIEKETGRLIGCGYSGDVTSTKSSFRKGDLLYGKLRPYLNKVWVAEFDGVCSTDILVFPQSMYVDNKFLFYRLLSSDFVKFAHQNSTGVNHPRTSYKAITRFQLLLPPLDEQQRIVARIEELFTQLDAGVAGLEKVRAQVKRYRQAVLQAAVEGKLTSQNGEVPSHWFKTTIEKVSTFVTDGDHNPPKRIGQGIPHLTARNIVGWKIEEAGCTFISEVDFEKVKKRYDPRKDDVIITCVGTLGRTAIVPENYTFSADRNLAIIRLISEKVLPKYMQIFLNSPKVQKTVFSASGSTAQPHLYLKDIRNICITVPSIEEQVEIIEETERLLSIADAMEKSIEQSLRQSARLRQSILQRAFCGKL